MAPRPAGGSAAGDEGGGGNGGEHQQEVDVREDEERIAAPGVTSRARRTAWPTNAIPSATAATTYTMLTG